jgi:hypothetical protein
MYSALRNPELTCETVGGGNNVQGPLLHAPCQTERSLVALYMHHRRVLLDGPTSRFTNLADANANDSCVDRAGLELRRK